MKTLSFLLLILGGAGSLYAGIHIDVVTVTAESLSTLPALCHVVRAPDGGVKLKLSSLVPSIAQGKFEAYELRVLKEPATTEAIARSRFKDEACARRVLDPDGNTKMEVSRGELPNAYLVIHVGVEPGPGGEIRKKYYYVPVSVLVRP